MVQADTYRSPTLGGSCPWRISVPSHKLLHILDLWLKLGKSMMCATPAVNFDLQCIIPCRYVTHPQSRLEPNTQAQ